MFILDFWHIYIFNDFQLVSAAIEREMLKHLINGYFTFKNDNYQNC